MDDLLSIRTVHHPKGSWWTSINQVWLRHVHFFGPAEAWRSDTSPKTVTSHAAWILMLGPSSKLQGASGSNTQDMVARTTQKKHKGSKVRMHHSTSSVSPTESSMSNSESAWLRKWNRASHCEDFRAERQHALTMILVFHCANLQLFSKEREVSKIIMHRAMWSKLKKHAELV